MNRFESNEHRVVTAVASLWERDQELGPLIDDPLDGLTLESCRPSGYLDRLAMGPEHGGRES